MLGNNGIEPDQKVPNVVQPVQQEKVERIRRRKEYILNFPNGEFKLTFIEPTTFVYHDQKGSPFGNFTVHELINYVAGNNLTPTAKKLIEMSICVIKESKPYNKISLNTRSPFMRDIEIINVLNRWMKQSEATYNDKPAIEQMAIRKFTCQILEHTLHLISIASKNIGSSSDEQKKSLMRLSSEILFRLTTIIQNETSEYINKYEKLKETIELTKEVKDKLVNQVEKTDIKEEPKKEDQMKPITEQNIRNSVRY
jgi:hypothetical protein